MSTTPTTADLPLTPTQRETLEAFHFARIPFEALREKLRTNQADPEAMHRLTEAVRPPPVDAALKLPARGTDEWKALDEEGRAMIARNELAVVILAGGMATRFGSVVKALAPCVEGTETRFIDVKKADVARFGGALDVTVMSSFATDAALRKELAGTDLHLAPQLVSLRMNPDGSLFLGNDGAPSLYATGHGDLPDALAASGTLDRYRARGVRTVLVMNVDNLGATVEPALLALHRRTKAAITTELVRKRAGDKGGIPVRRAEGDALVLAEVFRLPTGFPHDAFPLFNTNTLWIDVPALEAPAPWTWSVARKKVDGREAIQLERLVGELTWWHPSAYVEVPREGAESRFLPVKDLTDLASSQPEITAVLRERLGMKTP